MYMIIIIHYLSMKIIVSMPKGLSFFFMEVIRLKLWKTCYKVLL